jgi:hypothetical protein
VHHNQARSIAEVFDDGGLHYARPGFHDHDHEGAGLTWFRRAYAARYFIGFTAAGASVGLVAWLYEQGGFVTMLHAFGGLCLLVILAAIILSREIEVPAAQPN